MAQKRITILLDSLQDAELCAYLSENGVSNEGRRLLRGGLLLQQAGLLKALEFVKHQREDQGEDALTLLKMTMQMVQIFDNQTPEKPDRKAIEVMVTEERKTERAPKPSDPFAAGER